MPGSLEFSQCFVIQILNFFQFIKPGVFLSRFHSLFIFGASQMLFPLPGTGLLCPLPPTLQSFSLDEYHLACISQYEFCIFRKNTSHLHLYKYKCSAFCALILCFSYSKYSTFVQYLSYWRLPLAEENLHKAKDIVYLVFLILSLPSSKLPGTYSCWINIC